jgi:hypothetical protein
VIAPRGVVSTGPDLDRHRARSERMDEEAVRVRYDGRPSNNAVDILEIRGDKVSRETIYVMEGWEAPEWRAAPPHKPHGAPASEPAADPRAG